MMLPKRDRREEETGRNDSVDEESSSEREGDSGGAEEPDSAADVETGGPLIAVDPKRLERLESRAAEMEEHAKRIMAEYMNYRSRSEKERERAAQEAEERLLRRLCAPLGDLLRALGAATCADDLEGLKEGLAIVTRRFDELSASLGLEPINETGVPFDPHYHEAVLVREEEGVDPNTVVCVVEPGWLLRSGDDETVLVPAKVGVSGGPCREE